MNRVCVIRRLEGGRIRPSQEPDTAPQIELIHPAIRPPPANAKQKIHLTVGPRKLTRRSRNAESARSHGNRCAFIVYLAFGFFDNSRSPLNRRIVLRVPQQSPVPQVPPVPQRKHAVGEPKKDFLKIPNAYFDLIRENKLSGAIQRDIILILMRHTWGAKDRPEWAAISTVDFMKQCGVNSKGSVQRELQEMESRGLIASKTGDGCRGLKLFKLTQEKWKSAKPYAPLPQEQDADEPVASRDTLTLKPNARIIVPARLQLPDREPVDFRIAYTSSCSKTVQVSSTFALDLLDVRLSETEEKANHRSLQRPIQKANTDANNRLESLTAIAISLYQSIWGRTFAPAKVPADQKFLDQIVKAAGPDLPAKVYEDFVTAEVRTMHRRRKTILPGILVSLAEQAARQFAAGDLLARPENPPPSAAPEPLDPSKPWDKAREFLKAILSPESYENWFARSRQVEATGKTITVEVPDAGTAQLVNEEFHDQVVAACSLARVPEKIIWQVRQ